MTTKPMKRALEFKIVSEGWNSHVSPNGSVFKSRAVLARAWTTAPAPVCGDADIFLDQIHIMAFIPPEIPVDAPTPDPSTKRARKGLPREKLEIMISEEVWNIYDFPEVGVRLRSKYVLKNLFKIVGGRDPQGEQLYHMDGEFVVEPVER